VGVAFAILNFSFTAAFVVGFGFEIAKAKSNSEALGSVDRVDFKDVRLDASLRAALKNWSMHLETMSRMYKEGTGTSGDKFIFKEQMENENNLLLSRIKVAVQDELVIHDEKVDKVSVR